MVQEKCRLTHKIFTLTNVQVKKINAFVLVLIMTDYTITLTRTLDSVLMDNSLDNLRNKDTEVYTYHKK